MLNGREEHRVSSFYSCKGLRKRIADRFYGVGFENGNSKFYNLLRAHIPVNSLMLDLGAGRGTDAENPDKRLDANHPTRIGLDIDREIAANQAIDWKVIGSAVEIPFAADTFDVVFADYVMEHLSDPEIVCHEIFRVLRKGGVFIFRTNNIYHYSTLGSSIASQSSHSRIARMVRLPIGDTEPHPTFYKFNSYSIINNMLSETGFRKADLVFVETEPAYMMFNSSTMVAGIIYERLVNCSELLRSLRCNIHGICVK